MAVELVKSATLRTQLDPAGYVKGADQVVRSSEKVVAANDKVEKSNRQVDGTLRLSESGWLKFQASIDSVTRAQMRYGEQYQKINAYEKAGLAGKESLARAYANINRELAQAQNLQKNGESDLMRGGGMSLLRGGAGALGIGISAGALISFAKNIQAVTADLDEQAEQVGVSTLALQAYRAELKADGITSEQTDKLIQKFTRSIGEATEGSGKQRDAFVRLGLGAEDLAGGTEAALPKVAKALLEISDTSVRAKLEADLFGRSGQKLESALKDLIDPTSTLIERNRALGLVLGEDVTNGADSASDRLGRQWMRLKNDLAPMVVNFTGMLANLAEAYDSLVHRDIPAPDLTAPPAARTSIGFWGGSLNTNPAKTDGKKEFSNEAADKVIAKYKEMATNSRLDNVEQARRGALIEYANAVLESGNKVLTDGRGNILKQVRGLEDVNKVLTANQIKEMEGLAVTAAKGKEVKKTADQMEKIGASFDKWVMAQKQDIKDATLSTQEREKQNAVIMAAQEHQKEHNAKAKDLVQTYEDAARALGKVKTNIVEAGVAQQQLNALTRDVLDPLADEESLGKYGQDERGKERRILGLRRKYGGAFGPDQEAQVRSSDSTINRRGVDDMIEDMKEEQRLASMTLEKREQEEAVLNAIRQSQGDITDAQKDIIRGQVDLMQQTREWGNLLGDAAASFGDLIGGVVKDGRLDFQGFTQDILSSWGDMIGKMAQRWAQAQIFGEDGSGGLLGDILGTAKSAIGGGGKGGKDPIGGFFGLAEGGGVNAGQTVMVGENGPETFTPSVPGYVTPNDQLGGGGMVINFNMDINAPGATQQTVQQLRNMMRAELASVGPALISAATQAVASKMRNKGRGSL